MRQRARTDSDEIVGIPIAVVIEEPDLERGHKILPFDKIPKHSLPIRSVSARQPLYLQHYGVLLLVGWIIVALVVDPPFLVYFLIPILITSAIAIRTHLQTPTDQERVRRCWTVAFGCVLIGGAVLNVLWEFEIEPIDHHFDFPMLPSTNDDVAFYRMYNPHIDYNDKIEFIHTHLNHGSVNTARLAVNPSMDVWTSDVFRYEFLRHVWRSTADSKVYRVVCLAESDVVFDEAYIASLVVGDASSPLELAHVQHFWGHRVFEPFNIALLCTSSHVAMSTRRWTQVASFLHRKRYRRLLYLEWLYALLPNRLVLYWDAYHGCTKYMPHCKYIHFTQPKLDAITDAIQTIQTKVYPRDFTH